MGCSLRVRIVLVDISGVFCEDPSPIGQNVFEELMSHIAGRECFLIAVEAFPHLSFS